MLLETRVYRQTSLLSSSLLLLHLLLALSQASPLARCLYPPCLIILSSSQSIKGRGSARFTPISHLRLLLPPVLLIHTPTQPPPPPSQPQPQPPPPHPSPPTKSAHTHKLLLHKTIKTSLQRKACSHFQVTSLFFSSLSLLLHIRLGVARPRTLRVVRPPRRGRER